MFTSISATSRGVALVLIAAFLWSLSGVLIRLLHMDIWAIQLWRSLASLLLFIPILIATYGRDTLKEIKSVGKIDLFCAALGSIAMFSFINAVAATTVADVLVVYATLPFFAAFFGWIISKEAVGRRTLSASGVALAGVFVMVSASAGDGRMLGDLYSLVMTVTFALQLVILRKYRGRSIIVINIISVFLNVIICLCVAPIAVPQASELVIVSALGGLSMGLGMMLFTMGARLIASAKASLIGLIEVVLGPLWVWLAFNENPGGAAFVGGALVLAAVVWQIMGEFVSKKSMT